MDKAKASAGFSADILDKINSNEALIKEGITQYYADNKVKEGNQYDEVMMIQGVKSILYDEYYSLKEKGKKEAYKYFFVDQYFKNNIKNAVARLHQLLIRCNNEAFKVESYKKKAEFERDKHNLDAYGEYQAKQAEYEGYLKKDEASLNKIFDRYKEIYESKDFEQKNSGERSR